MSNFAEILPSVINCNLWCLQLIVRVACSSLPCWSLRPLAYALQFPLQLHSSARSALADQERFSLLMDLPSFCALILIASVYTTSFATSHHPPHHRARSAQIRLPWASLSCNSRTSFTGTCRVLDPIAGYTSRPFLMHAHLPFPINC